MKQFSIFCLLGIIIVLSCRQQSTKVKTVLQSSRLDSLSSETKHDSALLDKIFISKLTEEQLTDLRSKSKINIGLLSIHNRVLTLSSNSDLTYNLLGSNLSEQGLRSKYNIQFLQEIEEIEFNDTIRRIEKYLYKNSFFKIFYYTSNAKYYIACGCIKDPDIQLPYGINVGMSRESFFSKLFKESNIYNLKDIDTIANGSEDGGILQYFLFRDNILSEVVIKSEMDWIPCEIEFNNLK